MPLYVIECVANGTIEVLAKERPTTCPKCGRPIGSRHCKFKVSPHARTPGKWKVGR